MNNNSNDKKRIQPLIDLFKKFLFWIFSNVIWTVISFILPFGIIVPKILSMIKTKNFILSAYNIIIFAAFISIELFLIYSCIVVKKAFKKTDVTDDEQEEDNSINENISEYDKLDYYFEEYQKNLTVYKNGNGIITNSFVIVINDLNSVLRFKRQLIIKDAKVSTTFPPLREMKKTNLTHRFENFCFRCKCINNNDLILSVEERYWTEDSDNDDRISKEDPKILKWILRMNPSAIKLGVPYKIVYVISIPGMFPIENGYFKENIANQKGTHGDFNSKLVVNHKIKKFTFTLSFENGFKLYQKPTGKMFNGQTSENLRYDIDSNIIYDRYIFRTDDLNIGSSINIEWCFQEILRKGGKRNDQKLH